MDFDLSDDQRAILDAVTALLEQHAGAQRAISLQREGEAGEYDMELHTALAKAGFADMARGDGTGPLEAALGRPSGSPGVENTTLSGSRAATVHLRTLRRDAARRAVTRSSGRRSRASGPGGRSSRHRWY